MPLSEAQAYLDHLSSCSPCYRDFLQLQAQYRQRRTRIIFAVAASVLVVVGLATWAMLRQHDQRFVRVIVDLRDRSMSRGTEPLSEPPVKIPRNASHLEIYFPVGSSEGQYDVKIVTANGKSLFTGVGRAEVEQGVTTLRVNVSLSTVPPGPYTLQLRRVGSEWASYPLHLE